MKNHLQDVVKKRFKVSLDDLPEVEHRVVQHLGERRHISRDINLEFEKKLTPGQRLADRVARLLDLHHYLRRHFAFLGAAQHSHSCAL